MTLAPKMLADMLAFAFANNFPVLIKGKPGIGKSDIVAQAAADAGAELIISHPVVSDPTDYKGLPYAGKNGADFLPYGDLRKIINADKPTVFFLDDLGQAPASVQAACMQLLLAREINGHKVADCVTFVAATNRKEDRAGVSGILEPVKSRFASIVELDVSADEWIEWGMTKGNMPIELMAFIKFRPQLLSQFEASKDIVNSPCPRTVAYIGKMFNAGIPEELMMPAFAGAAGEGFAAEFMAFLRMYRSLPDIDQILLDPENVEVPTAPDVLIAISYALTGHINDMTADAAFKFIGRLPSEYQVATVKNTVMRDKTVTKLPAFARWAQKNGNALFN